MTRESVKCWPSTIEGDRGLIQLFAVMLDYPLGASVVRQAQVRQLAQLISATTHRGHPIVVCGDFNAGPDSDEIRMLNGSSATAEPGLVFYDAWEVAGDGSAGITWSNQQSPGGGSACIPIDDSTMYFRLGRGSGLWATPSIASCSASCRSDQLQLSDHYGVLADLRY